MKSPRTLQDVSFRSSSPRWGSRYEEAPRTVIGCAITEEIDADLVRGLILQCSLQPTVPVSVSDCEDSIILPAGSELLW